MFNSFISICYLFLFLGLRLFIAYFLDWVVWGTGLGGEEGEWRSESHLPPSLASMAGRFPGNACLNKLIHKNRVKNIHHMIISLDAERAFEISKNTFVMKVLDNWGCRDRAQHNKGNMSTPSANIIPSVETLKASTNIRNRTSISIVSFSTQCCVWTLRTIRQEIEIKWI